LAQGKDMFWLMANIGILLEAIFPRRCRGKFRVAGFAKSNKHHVPYEHTPPAHF